jgi:hypothetical protein
MQLLVQCRLLNIILAVLEVALKETKLVVDVPRFL